MGIVKNVSELRTEAIIREYETVHIGKATRRDEVTEREGRGEKIATV